MARTSGEQLSFIVVARTGPGPYPHPVEVALHPASRDTRMSFSIGPHIVNAGGQVALARVLDGDGLNPMFAEEFDAGDLHWLVPHLVRLRAGEDVTDEIVAAYLAKHGREPERMLQARYGE